jgi:hypothetical protein
MMMMADGSVMEKVFFLFSFLIFLVLQFFLFLLLDVAYYGKMGFLLIVCTLRAYFTPIMTHHYKTFIL